MPAARRHSFALGDVAKVMARRETFACAFQDDAADGLILVEVTYMGAQFPEHVDRQRIQLVWPVQREPAKAVVILACDEIAHIHFSRSVVSGEPRPGGAALKC